MQEEECSVFSWAESVMDSFASINDHCQCPLHKYELNNILVYLTFTPLYDV